MRVSVLQKWMNHSSAALLAPKMDFFASRTDLRASDDG